MITFGAPNPLADQNSTAEFGSTGEFTTKGRYGGFARLALVYAILAHVLFALIFFSMGVSLMVWVDLAGIALYAGCIVLARYRRSGLLAGVIFTEMLGHAVFATRAVGCASGFQYYAWLIVPLIGMSTLRNRNVKLAIATIAALICIGIDIWCRNVEPLTVLPPGTIQFLHVFNLAAYFLIVALLTFIYAQTVANAERGLRKHATTDALTGLRNRRRLLELARSELARVRRSGTAVSLIIADIDHFKDINDRFGHATGDQVIVAIAQCLQQCVRQQDHTARWGGEEFIIVLPDIDLQGAHAAAERMRERIGKLQLPADANTVRCTASFGVSEWKHGRDETFEQCLDRADAALYYAKQLGRNRVCLSPPPALTEHDVAEVLSAGNPADNSQTTPAESQATQIIPAHRDAS